MDEIRPAPKVSGCCSTVLADTPQPDHIAVGNSATGVAVRAAGMSFQKAGPQGVFQLIQPPWEGLHQSIGQENLAQHSLHSVLEGEFAQTGNICFVDQEKGFDLVPWGLLLHEYGVRGPLIRAVRSLYHRSRSLIHIASSKSELFPVHVGLQQGFVTGSAHNFYGQNF